MLFSRKKRHTGGRAIIIGGGITGLLASKILSQAYEEVILIEKDKLPTDGPSYRKGIPQSHHIHILLLKGRQLFEAFFPGIDEELKQQGAPLIDYTNDCVLVTPSGKLPRFPSHIKIRSCQRILIDWVLLNRVRAIPNVVILDQTRVKGLSLDDRQEKVNGIRLTDCDGKTSFMSSDLVIDASGRGSRASQWLGEFDYPAADEKVVNPYLGYASRVFEIPRHFEKDWRAVEVASHAPDNPRAAGLWEIENNRFLLTLIGTAKYYPPSTEEGFNDFAQRVSTPLVRYVTRCCKPVSDIKAHRGTENRWRRYDLLKRTPQSFLVLGDSNCAFNPTYGQGMTLSALSCEVLQKRLNKAQRRKNSSASLLTEKDLKSIRKSVARIAFPAWLLATSEDLRWATTTGGELDFMTKLSHRYMDLLLPVVAHSETIAETGLAVTNMVLSPIHLFSPKIMLEVVQHYLFRRNNDMATSS